MADQIELSIIVPCFNEDKRLPDRFLKTYSFFVKNLKNFELIFVDDGSLDKTVNLLRKYSKEYPEVSFVSYSVNQGKGYALKVGVEKARGAVVGFMDADFAVDIKQVLSAYTLIEDGNDLVIADRNLSKSSVGNNPNIVRRTLGRFLSYVNHYFLDLGDITDTQCGFKFFKGRVAKELFAGVTIYRWLFDIELIKIAREKKLRIKRIPVTWDEIEGSRVNLVKDFIPVALDLGKIYKRFFNLRIFSACLFLLLTIVLLPFFVNPQSLVQRNGDYSDLVWPDYFFIKESILKYHQLPFWNPTLFSGIPEIANPQSPLIYPPNILALVLPMDFGMVFLILIHFLVAGIYLYKLGSEELGWSKRATLVLTSGIIFSPFYWSKFSVGHLSLGFAMLFVGPILYYAFKLFKQFRFRELLLLCLFLAFQYLNHPTIWYYTIFFGGIFIILLKFRKILFVLLSALISLLFISPIFILQLQAGSLITRSQLSISDLAIPIWSIKRFLMSLLIPSNVIKDNEVEVWLYPSIILLITAFFGLLKLTKKLKLTLVFILFLIILITLGSRTPAFYLFTKIIPGFSYLRVSTRDWFVFVVVVSFLGAWFVEKTRSSARKLLVLFILADLVIFSALRIWFVPKVMQAGSDSNIVSLLKDGSGGRYYCISRCLSARETVPLGVNTADGYHLLILKNYREAVSKAGGFLPPKYTGNIPSVDDFNAQPDALELGKFNVGWVISKNDLTDVNFLMIKNSGEYSLYENLAVKERVRFENSTLNRIKVIEDTPNFITIESSGVSDKLILADTFYPGWRVYIDGREKNVDLYDGWARSVRVPDGDHKIEFKFEPFKIF